ALSADDRLIPHVGGGEPSEADVAKNATFSFEARLGLGGFEATLELAAVDAELHSFARDVRRRQIDGREHEIRERVCLPALLGADRGERRAACLWMTAQRHVEPHEVHARPIRLEQRLEPTVEASTVRTLEIRELDDVDFPGAVVAPELGRRFWRGLHRR